MSAVDEFVQRIRAERDADGKPTKLRDDSLYRVLDGLIAARRTLQKEAAS